MQIQPAQFNSPNLVYDEKLLGNAWQPGSGYDAVSPRGGLIKFSVPAQSFFRKVYLYMSVILTADTTDGYFCIGTVVFKFGGQVVAKMPAQIGRDCESTGFGGSSTTHMLAGKSVPTRFANPANAGRDSIIISLANTVSVDDASTATLTPAFIGIQADEVSFDFDGAQGWKFPVKYTPTGVRIWLGVDSSPFPY